MVPSSPVYQMKILALVNRFFYVQLRQLIQSYLCNWLSFCLKLFTCLFTTVTTYFPWGYTIFSLILHSASHIIETIINKNLKKFENSNEWWWIYDIHVNILYVKFTYKEERKYTFVLITVIFYGGCSSHGNEKYTEE